MTTSGQASDSGNAFETPRPFGPEEEAKKKTAGAAEALGRDAPHVAEIMGEAIATMRRRANGDEKPVPLPWPKVSEAMGGGLWPGFHVLTAGTGQGKTQFALQVAFSAARAGVPVLYVGLELGPLDLTARLLALFELEAGHHTSWSKLYLGQAHPDELERLVATHGAELAALSLRAEFGPPHGWGAGLLHDRVGAMRAETDPKVPILVVLDFLQLVGKDNLDDRADLRERISRAAYACRATARGHNAAVLALSSVSRAAAGALNLTPPDNADEGAVLSIKTPPSELVGLGKESGDIEFAADSVLAFAAEPYDERTRDRIMHLAVAKLRAGRPSWHRMMFDGSVFSEHAGPEANVAVYLGEQTKKPKKGNGKPTKSDPDPLDC